MILMNDGSKIQFDTEALQTRLIKCCLMCGVKDFHIAEDLTNAIENALSYQVEKGIFYTSEEVDLLIAKMLDDSGFYDVGAVFRTTIAETSKSVDMSEESNIRKTIEQTLNLSTKELCLISNKVASSCKKLGIIDAPETLILELAKFHRKENKELPKITNPSIKLNSDSKFIVNKNEIFEKLSSETQKLVNFGMIDFSGVSSIFPSVKLEILFSKLAQYHKLEGIITELQLFPCFPVTVEAFNEIISVTKESFLKSQNSLIGNDLPIYLKFSDIYLFAEKYFGVKLCSGEKFCNELAGNFAENLKYAVQIKIVKI